MDTPIYTAKIAWQHDHQGNVVPVCTQFDDIYFSKDDGLAESRYVFIAQNQLPQRFLTHFANQQKQPQPPFVIGETGFGTGLNFLATCLAWQHAHDHTSHHRHRPTLHFISTEKYPLTIDDLTIALSAWRHQEPSLGAWIDALISAYPLPIQGCHRRHLFVHGTHVMLDLWLGDAKDSLQQLTQSPHANGSTPKPLPKIDAWFLDGFAPSKNSDLWSKALFETIKALSKAETTLATFSAAGDIKRQLQALEATVKKVKGFGKKREMLTAHFAHAFDDCQPPTLPKTALIVGAGISGLMMAYSLSMRGVFCTLIDRQPLYGASGNLRALLCPKLGNHQQAQHHLPTMGYLYAQWLYQNLQNLPALSSLVFQKIAKPPKFYLRPRQSTPIFAKTGVIDLLLPHKKSSEQLHQFVNTYPQQLIHPIAEIADDTFSAFVPTAGLISPHALCERILNHPRIDFVSMTVHKLSPHYDGVQVIGTQALQQKTLQADIAIICAGFESHHLGDVFDGRKIRGQVSWTTDRQAVIAFEQKLSPFFTHNPPYAIKYDGYAGSFCDKQTPTLLFGASFVRNDTQDDVRDDEHDVNLNKLQQYFGDIHPKNLQGRASIRSQTPDYHPIAGQVGERIYTLTGMGSKGFSLAPLCGESLASWILGEFLPLSPTLWQKISPQRPRLQTPIDQTQ